MIAILVFEYFDSRQLEKYLMVSRTIDYTNYRVGYLERTQTNPGVCILCLKGNGVTSMKHRYGHSTEHDTYTDMLTQLVI